MKKYLSLCLYLILCASFVYAGSIPSSPGVLTEEVDGSPAGYVYKIILPNGTYTISNSVGTLDLSSLGGGDMSASVWDTNSDGYIDVAKGGTGAGTAANARTSLGLVIGTNVQAYSAMLDKFAAFTDPNADKLLYWADAGGTISSVTIGTGLDFTAGTLSSTASTADAAADNSTKGLATFNSNDFSALSGLITIDYTNAQKASAASNGFLTSTDWSTFNGKQAALGFTAENVANKSNDSALGTSATLYPTQNATKVYIDTIAAGKQGLATNLTTLAAPNAWRVFYSDGSGVITQLTPGADGTYLKSNGSTSAPTFATPSGAGDVLGPATNTDLYVPQWNGTNSKTLANGFAITAFAKTFLDDADAATVRATVGLAPSDAHYLTDQAEAGLSAEVVVSANGKSLVTAADYAAMKVLLGLTVGTDVQAYDAELAALAGLTSAANKLPYFTGSGTASLADLSAYGRTLIDDADASTARTTLGLAINTDVQAYDAELAALAGLTSAANKLPYFTGSGTASLADLSAFGRTVIDDADATTARTTLGLAIGTNVQAYDADLTTYAGITPSANVQSLLGAADYSAMRTQLSLVPGTNVQAYDADLATLAAPTAWRVFYSNGTSVLTELALGASGTYLKSNGASAAPTFDTPGGAGDVASVGDCASGACNDETSDGGTYIGLYSASGAVRLRNNAGVMEARTAADAGYAAFTAGVLTAGASGFIVDADGDVTAKSLTFTKSSGVAGDLGLYEANSSDTDAAGFKGPTALTANTSYRGQFPTARATSGNMVLAWTNSGESGTGTPADPYVQAMSFVDLDNYLLLAGGTLTGKLTTVTNGTAAGFNLTQSASDPSSPVNGDLWITASGLYSRIGGATVGPYISAASVVSDTAFGGGWNGSVSTAPSQNAVYDEMVLKAPLASPTFTTAVGLPATLSSAAAVTWTLMDNQASGLSFGATGAADIFKIGTLDAGPVVTVGGTLALGANNLTMTGSLGVTGSRITKGWFTDLEVTNAIAGSITGSAATLTGTLANVAASTSAQLYGTLSDETGSASGTPLAVFNQNPTINGATGTGVWDLSGATTLEIPNSDDPDVSAAGMISWDTDGWMRGHNGTAQVAIARIQEEIHVTVVKPQDMADAVRDAFMVWSNESGMTFVVDGWKGWSGTDDTTLNIEEADADGVSNNATVDAVELATGSGPYTGSDTTITARNIEAGHVLLLDFDDTDDPSYVKLVIYGHYLADVN